MDVRAATQAASRVRTIRDGIEGRNELYRIMHGGPNPEGAPRLITVAWYGPPGSGKTTGAQAMLCAPLFEDPDGIPADSVQYIYDRSVGDAIKRLDGTSERAYVLVDDAARRQNARRSMSGEVVAAMNDYNEIRHIFGDLREECAGTRQGRIVLCVTTQLGTGIDVNLRNNATVTVLASAPGDEARLRAAYAVLRRDPWACDTLDAITRRMIHEHDVSAASQYVARTAAGVVMCVDLRDWFAAGYHSPALWREHRRIYEDWESRRVEPDQSVVEVVAKELLERWGSLESPKSYRAMLALEAREVARGIGEDISATQANEAVAIYLGHRQRQELAGGRRRAPDLNEMRLACLRDAHARGKLPIYPREMSAPEMWAELDPRGRLWTDSRVLSRWLSERTAEIATLLGLSAKIHQRRRPRTWTFTEIKQRAGNLATYTTPIICNAGTGEVDGDI